MLGLILCRDDRCCAFTHVLVVMMMMVGLAGSPRHHQFYFSGWPFILVPGKLDRKRKGFIIAICNSNLLFWTIYRIQEDTSHFFIVTGPF